MARHGDDRPAVGGFGKPRKTITPWKPDVCEEPGCNARHPSFSRDGIAGPWRCRRCDANASPTPSPALDASPAEPPPEPPQGRLL
jgi:hypothetical protein